MLLDQPQRFESPLKWWRDCVKHLPADDVTENTLRLCKGIDYARRMIEIASANWDAIYELNSDPDCIMPGFLLMLPNLDRRGLGVKPLSLVGLTRTEDQDMVEILLSHLPDRFEAGIWVFGAMVSGYSETFALAAHRDGTRTAACHLDGQWINKVPTFFARHVAYLTTIYMIDEGASEQVAFAQALTHATDQLEDLDANLQILKELANRIQVPYMEAWWRMAINQFAEETAEDFEEDFRAIRKDARNPPNRADESHELRQRLAASKEREQALLRDLRLAKQTKIEPPPVSESRPVVATAAQRLSAIF